MAENVLISYINNKLTLAEVVKWLNSPENWESIERNFNCNIEDFVSYFLNFIHEEFYANDLETTNNITSNESSSNKCLSRKIQRSDLNLTWPRTDSDKRKGLCLGDFVTKKTTPTRQKRRIKPTFVQEKNLDSERNKENFVGVSCRNIEEGRSLIMEDLVGLQKNNLNLEINLNRIKPRKIDPEINFGDCTNITTITLIANLYVYLFKNNFILNTLSELYFLISLLNTKKMNDLVIEEITTIFTEEDLKAIFKSKHNQVFFSLEVLSDLTNYLKIFDKSTLNLLIDNQTLKNFNCATFKNNLKVLIDEKQLEKIEVQKECILDVRNVNFTTETDNRDNFICDASFHAFRKQRDMFYDILKIWEEKRNGIDWNFSTSLSYKIKTLLGLWNDPVNFRQLAKLFKSQLLLVCYKEIEDDPHLQNEEAILQHFPTMDSSKLNKLKVRLSSKSESLGLDSPPGFFGYQQFFKDFILNCPSCSFLEHLQDVFRSEILTLNKYEFTGYDLTCRGDLKNQAVRSVKEKLRTLLVLAKFLGFIESLPFQCDFKKVPKKIVQNQINSRFYHRGMIEIDYLLIEAIEKRRISFTTTWVVIYLSMLDFVSLRLPFFEKTIEILFFIYKNCVGFDSYTELLLRCSLNYLFGLPHFPGEFHYRFFFKKPEFKMELDHFQDCSDEYFLKILNGKVQTHFPIDKLNLINESTLWECYPVLEIFKNVLSSKNQVITRHITPLRKVECPRSKVEVQKRLEEAFLNSQPGTVRKIIEFSTEKITSGCVRYLSAQLTQIKRSLVNNSDKIPLEIPNIQEETKVRCMEISDKIITEKTNFAMRGLMPVEELSLTVEKCAEISRKICQEKVKMWLDSTVTLNSIEKIVNQEGRKFLNKNKVTSNIPSGGKDVKHCEETMSAVKILDKLKNLIINIIENGKVEEEIEVILGDSKKTICNRSDVNDNISLGIFKLTLELCVVLVCFQPDLADDLLEDFRDYWTYFKVSGDVFKSIVSPRNIHMLSRSTYKKKSWGIFAKLLMVINRNGLITPEDFERQCLGVFQRNWEEETLGDICNCYQYVIKNLGDEHVHFSQLLTFVSSYCLDLNNF